MRCPRRDENPTADRRFPGEDSFDAEDNCSYCGSLDPDVLMAHLEAGDIELGSTDKNYKAYIEGLPNPNAGKLCIRSSTSGGDPDSPLDPEYVSPRDITDPEELMVYEEWSKHSGGDHVRGVRFSLDSPHRFAKFYFQHLTSDQQKRFIELLNEHKIKFSGGYGFYVLPFFCTRAKEAS